MPVKSFITLAPGLFKLVMSSPRAATSIHCFLACVSATLTGDNYPSYPHYEASHPVSVFVKKIS